jgi:vacuolar-type H+-ATPase subunit B/Vma2
MQSQTENNLKSLNLSLRRMQTILLKRNEDDHQDYLNNILLKYTDSKRENFKAEVIMNYVKNNKKYLQQVYEVAIEEEIYEINLLAQRAFEQVKRNGLEMLQAYFPEERQMMMQILVMKF